jgi:hypothetical protein
MVTSATVPRKGGRWMQNYEGFSLQELEGVGIVCSKCNTEVVFDVHKAAPVGTSQSCPGCGDSDFIQLHNPFGTRPFSVVAALKNIIPLPTKSEIRLYFGKQLEDKE